MYLRQEWREKPLPSLPQMRHEKYLCDQNLTVAFGGGARRAVGADD